jgi:hypothetical protein
LLSVPPTTPRSRSPWKTQNPGILVNTPVSVAITIDSGGNGGTSITATPNSGISLAGAGGSQEVTLDITTSGEDNNVTVYATVTVTHQAGDNPPTARTFTICVTVSDDYVPLTWATLATTCKRLRVYNNGQMANNTANETMDFINPPDSDNCANVYLYDASPIICRDDGGTTRCYFTVYENDYASDHALRQVSPMFHDPDSNTDYEYASAEFITGDSTIGLIVEYFAPKQIENCSFIIQKLKFWNRTEVTLTHVKVGEALDWDIPNWVSEDDTIHASSDNQSGYDTNLELIYQYSCWEDDCDSTSVNHRFGGIAAYKANPFRSYQTLENDVYVYSTGPFGQDAPLPDDTMYALMDIDSGYYPAVLVPEDTCEDLFTLVTFGVYDLEPADTQCVVKILTTSHDDTEFGDAMKANVGLANDFIDNHEEIQCPSDEICDCLPGDANNDGTVNIGDAVYVIAYVFKGGPPPTPYPICSGDANCDCQCNIGDAVYVIAYVFKGGPAPCSCEEWLALCGPPLRK